MSQIASEMKYLSSFQIIHPDLATRNYFILPTNHQLHQTDVVIIKSDV